MELVGTGWPCEDVDMATDLDRLAKLVRAHRHERFPSRDAAADAAGISRNTWKKVEEGQPVRESTYVKIEKVLDWASGSWERVAAGHEPVLAAEGGGGSAATPAPFDEEEARRAAWQAARLKLPNAPIGDIDAFAEEFVEILRRSRQGPDGV